MLRKKRAYVTKHATECRCLNVYSEKFKNIYRWTADVCARTYFNIFAYGICFA